MTHIRLATTEEIMQALQFLKREKYPVLSFPEIVKAVISEAVTEMRNKKVATKKRKDTIPTSKELMAASAEAFGVHDPKEVTYTAEDGKPFTLS